MIIMIIMIDIDNSQSTMQGGQKKEFTLTNELEKQLHSLETTNIVTALSSTSSTSFPPHSTNTCQNQEQESLYSVEGGRGMMLCCCICGTWIHEKCLDVDQYPCLGEWNQVKCMYFQNENQ